MMKNPTFSPGQLIIRKMMSNEDEKRCPLCAEEMDWTDQQFKPCKCGYQVCVWCWHHIMDMAEKDETEGRCPACRTIYEKEKIVAMQANCERMASNISNRKSKPPKAKPKTNEVKKDLTDIRVIQRKMAYVIGLPLSLADEDILQRKEYFGQYGKVTKISLSRTAGGAIQQFVNDSCSLYITYSKEEEAIRCIQSIHGYSLDGRLLRASFGTAKYCHAWLRNLACNNPGCLYLHSFGAEEDSFSKDEAAAVQTRNRVQQIVGEANNSMRRSGNVLPPPIIELNNTTSARSLDPWPGVTSSSCQVSNMLQPTNKDGGIGAPSKITTFLEVVGRPSSSNAEKDAHIVEDKRILNICSDLSSLTVDKDIHDQKLYSDPRLYKASSSDYLMNGFSVESGDIPGAPYNEDFRLLNVQRSNSGNVASHRDFLQPSYPSETREDSVGQFSMHERSHSASNFSLDHNALRAQEAEAPLPVTSMNSVLEDGFHETKFQSSAKTDRIYRGSNSFSNEEIVEHLRRVSDDDDDDADDDVDNGDENSALSALERRVISNIMSRILDTGDDSSKLPDSLSEIDDDNNKGHHGSSWNSQNNDNTCFPFLKQDMYAPQMADYGSSFSSHMSSNSALHQDLGESKDRYLYKSQIAASKPQVIAPPGFSKPSRDPPPGFSASERTDRFSRVSSGNHLMDNSALPTTLLRNPSTKNGTFSEIDFIDPTILSCGKSRTNSFSSIGSELKHTCLQQNGFGDEERLWSLMQQSNSKTFLPQASSPRQQTSYPIHNGDWISNLDEVYGFSSRLTDQRQTYEPPSLTPFSQQNYPNGHISNSYQSNSDGVQLRNELSIPDLQRNERLGFSKYFPGYGDMRLQMPVSGDVYTRLFGM